MKCLTYVCLIGLVISFVGIIINPCTSADLIDPSSGEKMIVISYSIDNIDVYDDYVFILFDKIFGYQIINPDQSVSFYKFAKPSIYAVNESKFSEINFKDNKSMLNDFFEYNPNVIRSDLTLSATYGFVPKNDPLKSAQIILTIVSMDENVLNIDKSKIIFTYNDGISEEKIITSQNILPKPSRSAILPYWFESLWYIWIPGSSIISIVSILLYRKRITNTQ